jgi:hypothetical protein
MRHVWLLGLLAAACWPPRPALAQPPTAASTASSECQAKAGFLLNFIKDVELANMVERK